MSPENPAARTAIERAIERPLIILQLPAIAALPDPNDDTDRMLDGIERQDDDEDDDDEDDENEAVL